MMCTQGHTELMKWVHLNPLLFHWTVKRSCEHGVDKTDAKGRTALMHIALTSEDLTNCGCTAYHPLSCPVGNYPRLPESMQPAHMAFTLLRANANVLIRDSDGKDAYTYFSESKYPTLQEVAEWIKVLCLERKTDLVKSNIELVPWLKRAEMMHDDADMDKRNKESKTFRYFCLKDWKSVCITFLLLCMYNEWPNPIHFLIMYSLGLLIYVILLPFLFIMKACLMTCLEFVS